MAFSQSFSLGENTLNQLDVDEVNLPSISKNVNKNKPITPTNSKRSHKTLNSKSISNDFANRSPVCNENNSTNLLDIIDESPTEKTNVFGKSIRERLKNASTSKKYDRKHMRRSRSDPITASDSKRSDKSSAHRNHGFTEDFGTMFDNTIEWDAPDELTRKKSKHKIKLDEKFEDDDIDRYFENFQTPGMQRPCIDTNKTKNNSLITLSDSGELEHVNVSEIERLMRTENFGKAENSSVEQDEIQWEDSAYFNDLLASQQKTVHQDNEHDSLAEVAIDAEVISMHSGRIETVDDEMESCFLEVSMHLSDLNASMTKSMHKNGTQLDASILSRSIKEKTVADDDLRHIEASHNSIIPLANKLSIDTLSEWSCSASIIKAYKKKGIEKMFEWQAECLSNPKVNYELH